MSYKDRAEYKCAWRAMKLFKNLQKLDLQQNSEGTHIHKLHWQSIQSTYMENSHSIIKPQIKPKT